MSTHSTSREESTEPPQRILPESLDESVLSDESFCSTADALVNFRPVPKKQKKSAAARESDSDSEDEVLGSVALPESTAPRAESTTQVIGFVPDHMAADGSGTSKREPPGESLFGVLSQSNFAGGNHEMLRSYLEMFIQSCRGFDPVFTAHEVFADITQPEREPAPKKETCAYGLEAPVRSESDMAASRAVFHKEGFTQFTISLIEEGQTSGNLISNNYANYLVSEDVVDGMRPIRNYHTRDVNWISSGPKFHDLLDLSTLDVSGGDGSTRGITIEALVAKNFLVPGILKNMKKRLHIYQFTAIQSAISYMIVKKPHYDIICQAESGSGKTTAYLIALVTWIHNFKVGQERKHIDDKNWRHPKLSPYAVILVPNRELAAQISCFAKELTKDMTVGRVTVAASYGDMPISTARRHINSGCDIVVGTPSRILSHFQCNFLKTDNLFWTVLDEADHFLGPLNILESGIEELLTVIKKANKSRIYAFSGAFNMEIVNEFKSKFMRPNPFEVTSRVTPTSIGHHFVQLEPYMKRTFLQNLFRVLRNGGRETPKTIVFVENQVKCDFIYNLLHCTGFPCLMFHKSMFQSAREFVLSQFAHGVVKILIATDVAARGLNFKNVKYVINYDLPNEPEEYFNRAGRTGRMGNIGTVINFIELGRNMEPVRITKLVPAFVEAGLRPAPLLYYSYDQAVPNDILRDLNMWEDMLKQLEETVFGEEDMLEQIANLHTSDEPDRNEGEQQ